MTSAPTINGNDPHDVYRRQTGLLVMAVAFAFWIVVITIAFATQASFFSMEEYLLQPMWTEDVPWIVNLLLGATVQVIGLTRLALLAAGIVGVVLVSSRVRSHGLYRFSWVVFALITANTLLYEVLAVVGYLLARSKFPNGYALTATVAGGGLVVLGSLALLVWASGRRMLRVAAAQLAHAADFGPPAP